MKPEYKKTLIELTKNVLINLFLTALIIFLVVFVLNRCLNVEIQISTAAIILGVIGAAVSFTGSAFISDALGRWGAHNLPQYKIGNRMQTIGFALAIAALLVK